MMRILILFLFLLPIRSLAQQGIIVDSKGALRGQKDQQKVFFFGVNYTVPFAYGYRSVIRSGSTIEQAIDNDVYHFARMGLNAFRVHVWDTEISDASGNLLNNEHLRLFDYLLFRLEQRGIHTMLTPLAFWGNGYPEKDSMTGSFSSIYNKQRVLVEEPAIRAQENYLKQFLSHVNPYTKKKYMDDRFVVGLEINNEPHHSGSLDTASAYINRMVKAVKSAGWKKPVFYNISESPRYAKAVAESDIDGVSFQWYPTGLVANHTQRGNFLPNVDEYTIPFDTIAAFKNKARMVYEFDAADILAPIMYPAMARSFRKAGFQWATQFAYDPMATASGNTEYQTHYLNLAYTPQKAISMMIAAKVFMSTDENTMTATYPADTVFGNTLIYPREQKSEWNSKETFYYTGSTSSKPLDISSLLHIAGSGNSELVRYSGNGAYFLDKISDGVWRFECMPDVVQLADPFGRAAPGRTVRKLEWNELSVTVDLPDLGPVFHIDAINKGNNISYTSDGSAFLVNPGVYILRTKGKSMPGKNASLGNIKLNEFSAPLPSGFATDEKVRPEANVDPYPITDLFTVQKSRNQLMIMNPDWNNYKIGYPAGDSLMEIRISDSVKGKMFAWQLFTVGLPDLKELDTLKLQVSANPQASFRIGLVDMYGTSYYLQCSTDMSGIISIPLSSLAPGKSLLLPRPYPGFQPLWFDSKLTGRLSVSNIDKLEFIFISDGIPRTISIGRISLQ
jgi:Cellulase (glycosyl hydrolase family 5)